jgi:hypothetical protein
MGVILVRVGNANRDPLNDRMDVHLVNASTDATAKIASNVPGQATVRFDGLIERQAYLVKVFPVRHRPVAEFVIAGSDAQPTVVKLYAPLHPEHVRSARFPKYSALDVALRDVLDRSTIDGEQAQGEALYDALSNTQKAGLFNLFARMSGVELGGQRTVWSFVDRLFGVRGDRIYVDVQSMLPDLVAEAIESELFRDVPGGLHEAPAGYGPAGSFKTGERHGNLQLTFFSSLEPPRSIKVDADIDDAAGLGHVFQVLRNTLTRGTTHPYDIHQILVFRHEPVSYELA